MTVKGKTKTFDALEMVRKVRDKMTKEMKGMPPEKRVEYIRAKAAETDARIRGLHPQHSKK